MQRLISSDMHAVTTVPQWVSWSNCQLVEGAVPSSIASVTTARSSTCFVECRARLDGISWWIFEEAWPMACAYRICLTTIEWDIRPREFRRREKIWKYQHFCEEVIKLDGLGGMLGEVQTTCYRGRTGQRWSRAYAISANIVQTIWISRADRSNCCAAVGSTSCAVAYDVRIV